MSDAHDPDPAGKEVKELNCFVAIGFGRKTDLATGRVLDLDRTFTDLIKPAFDKLNQRRSEFRINCFRAIDKNRSGSIDKVMYHWIYHADLVVTDLSTMNANVLYELGVRHAQRAHTSILIAENDVFGRIPFDLSHAVIHGYEHLGDSFALEEVERFTDHLADLVETIIASPEIDSPVYTYMDGMTPPNYVAPPERHREEELAPAEIHAGEIRKQSLSILAGQAEVAKNAGDFVTAGALLRAALEHDPTDAFLRQRLALCTYKAREHDEDDEAAIQALRDAEAILAPLHPATSTDPETLGLSGAIRKRMWERTGDPSDLELAIGYYERGFYIAQDYYNGINVAYLYNVKADITEDLFEATIDFGHAKRLRRKVAEICRGLIEGGNFEARADKEWIYQTLAQACLGDDRVEEAEALIPTIAAMSGGTFDLETFRKQNAQLVDMIAQFKQRAGGPATPA